ncbi:MAG TPA: hypothetical protein DCY07_03935 [Rhodospirillaceae bacterium]|nr:hypothetical protein [Rhodospirillaceae bacterium]
MKRFGIQIAACVGLVLSSSPVWAEDHGGKTLPQLDVALFPGVLFWMAAAFITFFVLMTFIGVPGIKKTIDNRRSLLDADLAAAGKAGEQASLVVAAYEASLLDARHKAQETVSDIVAAAAEESAAHREKQDQELKHRMVVANENIAQAKEEALKDTQQFVNDLVQEIVGKVMRSGIETKTGQARS